MGSLLLPDLRVDSRRGLPPGKAGRVDPRETQTARLKRMSATAAEDAGAWEGSDGRGDTSPLRSSSRPSPRASPPEKHPSRLRPRPSGHTPPAPGGGGFRTRPYERPRRPRAPQPGPERSETRV